MRERKKDRPPKIIFRYLKKKLVPIKKINRSWMHYGSRAPKNPLTVDQLQGKWFSKECDVLQINGNECELMQSGNIVKLREEDGVISLNAWVLSRTKSTSKKLMWFSFDEQDVYWYSRNPQQRFKVGDLIVLDVPSTWKQLKKGDTGVVIELRSDNKCKVRLDKDDGVRTIAAIYLEKLDPAKQAKRRKAGWAALRGVVNATATMRKAARNRPEKLDPPVLTYITSSSVRVGWYGLPKGATKVAICVKNNMSGEILYYDSETEKLVDKTVRSARGANSSLGYIDANGLDDNTEYGIKIALRVPGRGWSDYSDFTNITTRNLPQEVYGI